MFTLHYMISGELKRSVISQRVNRPTWMPSEMRLIIPNGIEDPVKTEEVGVFTNPDIQALYDQLIETGSASVQDAVTIGLMIEDMDIFDLEEVIANVDDETVKEVMGHLQDGSETT